MEDTFLWQTLATTVFNCLPPTATFSEHSELGVQVGLFSFDSLAKLALLPSLLLHHTLKNRYETMCKSDFVGILKH